MVWRAEKKKRRERRRAEFGTNPIEQKDVLQRTGTDAVSVYYNEMKGRLPEYQVDETTWNDLDMEQVFFRINHTRSYLGEQILYHRLHDLRAAEEWEAFERGVSYAADNEEGRLNLEEELEKIGKCREAYYLPMFLLHVEGLEVSHISVYYFLQVLLAASLFAGVVLSMLQMGAGRMFLMICVGTSLINLVVYALAKTKYEVYLYALGGIGQLVSFCKTVLGEPQWRSVFYDADAKKAEEELRELTRLIGRYRAKKRGAFTGEVLELVSDYLIGVTLWDFTVFQKIVRFIGGRREQLLKLYAFAGEIDMAISTASFRKSLPLFCIPGGEKGRAVCAEGIYHPLLSDPVCNDISLAGNCMVTGANASGKSTFIKTVAVNAILAQTIHTCAAVRFSMCGMRVMTSMAVRDDILSGESYYMKEAAYLKRIVDAVSGELPVLCVIDEILRGTNTGERLAASLAVLKYLETKNCIAVVATHDMELAERLEGEFTCYYFKSEFCKEDILFDYKLYRGLGQDRNAIKLLAFFGYPGEIVRMAEQVLTASCTGTHSDLFGK